MSKKRKMFPLSFSFNSGEISIRHNGRPIDGIRNITMSRDFNGPIITNIEAIILPPQKKKQK